jgi:hypothetical protein
LEEAIKKAKCLYEKNKGRPHFQKDWNDKKKRKMDQRKKGFKTTFFRNIPQTYQQGKLAQSEPNMLDSLGKIPRQQPIKCLGCDGDRMYKDFSHKGERMRSIPNI